MAIADFNEFARYSPVNMERSWSAEKISSFAILKNLEGGGGEGA